SYFEWVQGMQNFFWGLDEINKKLHDILKQSFSEVVGAADQYKVNMKTAALIVALRRLERAMKLRGLFPG
ncbi:MAG: glutamate dehydrogenase, partial [Bdellovibrio sp. CG_4_9_14_3_um_filter_39_7]